jgi:hypothetical protein
MFYVYVLSPEAVVVLCVILWVAALIASANAREWNWFLGILLFPPIALAFEANRAPSLKSIRARIRRRSRAAAHRRQSQHAELAELRAKVESLESDRGASAR